MNRNIVLITLLFIGGCSNSKKCEIDYEDDCNKVTVTYHYVTELINLGFSSVPGEYQQAITPGGYQYTLDAYEKNELKKEPNEDYLPSGVITFPLDSAQEEKWINQVTKETVYFDLNEWQLSSQEVKKLDAAINRIDKNNLINITIEGHSDSIGSDRYNHLLSKKRADFVKNHFVNKGFEKNKITAIGFGEKHPVANNETDEGRASNRRAEITPLIGEQ